MLLISDNLLIKYSEANDRLKLEDFVNKKLFTVADTPLTYRQINSLDTDSLLTNDRKGEGWRKFSFKELIYILIVNDLKGYGLKHSQLKPLWQVFFKEPTAIKPGEPHKGIGEVAIGCVFGQVEIRLSINKDGQIAFYDPTHYILFPPTDKTHIDIKLNDYVNGLLKKIGKPEIPVQWSVQKKIYELGQNSLTSKEKDVLDIIRNKEYTAIKIKKTNGEIALAYAEKAKNDSVATSEKDLLKLLNSRDFQDLTIVKRDGKIVNYKIEETIKF